MQNGHGLFLHPWVTKDGGRCMKARFPNRERRIKIRLGRLESVLIILAHRNKRGKVDPIKGEC